MSKLQQLKQKKKRDAESDILSCMLLCELNIPFAHRILSYVPGEEEVEIGGTC